MYAVAGGKGGVGKTTTTVNLAAALQADGYDTVVVDADLGMTNLGELMGIDTETSIHEVLADRATVEEAVATGEHGVAVLAGERDLDAYGAADPAKLRPVTEHLREAFDVVLVDTGAGLSHASLVPFGLADGVVVVTTPDDVAATDASKTADMVREVDGTVLGAVVTRTLADTDPEAVAERVGERLLESVPEVGEVAGDEPMVETAPDSDPAEAYRRLAATVELHADVERGTAGEGAGAAESTTAPTSTPASSTTTPDTPVGTSD